LFSVRCSPSVVLRPLFSVRCFIGCGFAAFFFSRTASRFKKISNLSLLPGAHPVGRSRFFAHQQTRMGSGRAAIPAAVRGIPRLALRTPHTVPPRNARTHPPQTIHPCAATLPPKRCHAPKPASHRLLAFTPSSHNRHTMSGKTRTSKDGKSRTYKPPRRWHPLAQIHTAYTASARHPTQ
jgi:hypothetical protein